MGMKKEKFIFKDVEDLFPDDILFQILLWLPVSSLLRFKSVCKYWYALIQSQDFIDQHLRRSHQTMDHNLLFFNHTQSVYYQLYTHNLEFSKQMDSPRLPPEVIVDSIITCNGLVCVEYHRKEHSDGFPKRPSRTLQHFGLWNPALKEWRSLLRPPLLPDEYFYNLGFGFDARTNCYNLVLINTDVTNSCSRVYRYNLSMESWSSKLVDMPDNVSYIVHNPNTQVRDGCYTWFGASETTYEKDDYPFMRNRYVLSYDFFKEVFEAVPLPEACNEDSAFPCLGILKGCIVCVNIPMYPSDPHEVWMLREYGVKESWTEICSAHCIAETGTPLGLLKTGECFLFKICHDQVCICNNVTGQIHTVVQSCYNSITRGTDTVMGDLTIKNDYSVEAPHALYKESLVSVRGKTMVTV